MDNYFHIGKLAASIGLKGELILEHSLGKKSDFKNIKALFIEMRKDDLIPYFIVSAKAKSSSESIISLEGIDIVEQARKLTPKQVWVTAKDFDLLVDKQSNLALLGYQLFDQNKNLVGQISEVIEQPHQILVSVNYKNADALIPLHEKNIININAKTKQVFVDIPDGLLELYI